MMFLMVSINSCYAIEWADAIGDGLCRHFFNFEISRL